jgi:hypothetical protein
MSTVTETPEAAAEKHRPPLVAPPTAYAALNPDKLTRPPAG